MVHIYKQFWLKYHVGCEIGGKMSEKQKKVFHYMHLNIAKRRNWCKVVLMYSCSKRFCCFWVLSPQIWNDVSSSWRCHINDVAWLTGFVLNEWIQTWTFFFNVCWYYIVLNYKIPEYFKLSLLISVVWALFSVLISSLLWNTIKLN